MNPNDAMLIFIYGVHHFPRMLFFPNWMYSSFCWELLRQIIFTFIFFFSLETFYWPIYGAFLITLKSWNVIFYVFYSNFSQVIFLKEQDLLREKRAHFSFSWKKGTFFSCYFYIDAYNRACHPPWQIEKCNSCAFRMVEISKIFWGQTREQTPAGGLECLLKPPQLHCRLLMAVQK